MGLGAPKKRTKLSHDPNNNAWSRSTETFGHRILTAQGWKPGDYLGADNATHPDHYTAANASHIRVLLREDNLGLGAKVGGKANAETFGLSTLSGIFGRLNGKSDEDVQKQQGQLRDAELRSYQAQKYGYMNFVRGGLLVGDKIEAIRMNDPSVAQVAEEGQVEAGKSERKRKRKQEAREEGSAPTKHKKSKSDRQDQVRMAEAHTEDVPLENKALIKDRRRKGDTQVNDVMPKLEPGEAEKSETARLKAEKRARKEERRKRKEERRQKKDATSSEQAETLPGDATTMPGTTSTSTTASDAAMSTPTLTSGQSTPVLFSSRHAVRQRYIQQKRLASMDPKALNEILMIKASG